MQQQQYHLHKQKKRNKYLNRIKQSSKILLVIFLFLITINSALGACNETQVYNYYNFTDGTLIQNKTSIHNITSTQICTSDNKNYLPVVVVVLVLLSFFLFLAWLTDFFYAKMIFVMVSVGFSILLYALGMRISQELGVVVISNLMSAGYPVVIYSSLTLIGLMMVYMVYKFFMEIQEVRRNGKG